MPPPSECTLQLQVLGGEAHGSLATVQLVAANTLRPPPPGAVREGDWKLVEWYEDGKLELFNLKEDISEESDLAKKYPDKVKTLAVQLAKWRKDTGAKMPVLNKNFDPNKREGR